MHTRKKCLSRTADEIAKIIKCESNQNIVAKVICMRRTGSHLGLGPLTLEDNARGATSSDCGCDSRVEVFQDTCWLFASGSGSGRQDNNKLAMQQQRQQLQLIIIFLLADDSITNEHLNGDAGQVLCMREISTQVGSCQEEDIAKL